MAGNRKQKVVIRLERGGDDHILPKGFSDVVMNRFLPVLSLTYVSMILALAARSKDFFYYLTEDNTAYIMGLVVVLWVSIPGMLWILLNGNPLLRHTADTWYRIISIIMTLTIMLSFILFPEAEVYGLRFYFVITVPVFLVMYFFFVKGGLPAVASYPLNALGFIALIYGSLINLIF